MTDLQPIAQNDTPQSVFMHLVTILFIALMGTFVASLLVHGLSQFMGLDYAETIANLKENTPNRHKNFIKAALNISHLCTFILPSLIFLWWTYGKNWKKIVNLSTTPSFVNSLFSGLLLLAAFPFVQFIFSLNKKLPLPTWAVEQEELINTTIEHLLYVQSTPDLLFNLLTIAILPAIGEELLFRGIIQTNIEKGVKNPHIAIWLTALIFSFIHFQFQGFIPRVLLGALLGYLFVWSHNLWLPIIAHLIYNASQILLQYGHQKGVLGMDLNEIETVPIWLVALSIGGMIGLGWLLYNRRYNDEL